MSTASCEAVRDALRRGRDASDPELSKHAAECAQCGALLEDQAALGRVLASEGPGAGETLPWAGVETLLKEEVGWRAWLRSRPHRVRVLFAAGAYTFVTVLGLRRIRPDFERMTAYELAGLLVAFGLIAGASIQRALPVVGRPAKRGALEAGVLGAGFGVPMLAAFVHTATPGIDGTTFVRQAWSCFSYGSLLTIPLVAVLWLLDRGAGPRTRLYYGAAAAGLAANAALTLHCPNTSSPHLLLGHATIGLALAAVAWLVLRRR